MTDEAPTPVPAAVAADLASDRKGEPRSPRAKAQPPPGTVDEGFWGRSVTHGAVVLTVGLGLTFVRSLILQEPVSREAVAVGVEAVTWAWLGAFGIHVVGPAGLRRK